jgi:hypothetical protein
MEPDAAHENLTQPEHEKLTVVQRSRLSFGHHAVYGVVVTAAPVGRAGANPGA